MAGFGVAGGFTVAVLVFALMRFGTTSGGIHGPGRRGMRPHSLYPMFVLNPRA